MKKMRYLHAALGLAALLVAGSAYGERTVIDDPTTEATAGTGPFVEIVVFDGQTTPAVVAGCSETGCMGYGGPGTGSVTNPKNNIATAVSGADMRSRRYLYVDGQYVTAARPGRSLVWTTTNLSAGPHTVEVMAYSPDHVEGWSTPLTLEVVK